MKKEKILKLDDKSHKFVEYVVSLLNIDNFRKILQAIESAAEEYNVRLVRYLSSGRTAEVKDLIRLLKCQQENSLIDAELVFVSLKDFFSQGGFENTSLNVLILRQLIVLTNAEQFSPEEKQTLDNMLKNIKTDFLNVFTNRRETFVLSNQAACARLHNESLRPVTEAPEQSSTVNVVNSPSANQQPTSATSVVFPANWMANNSMNIRFGNFDNGDHSSDEAPTPRTPMFAANSSALNIKRSESLPVKKTSYGSEGGLDLSLTPPTESSGVLQLFSLGARKFKEVGHEIVEQFSRPDPVDELQESYSAENTLNYYTFGQ